MNRKITVALGLLVLFDGVLWGQTKAERVAKLAAFREEAMAREQALAAAEMRGDLHAILAALVRDFFEIGADGTATPRPTSPATFPTCA